ncbi:MAG: TatD family hydrolase [Muribaculaceae bacterium]|nr:TatD family hydrolase [Muribaculaceae bacterium]
MILDIHTHNPKAADAVVSIDIAAIADTLSETGIFSVGVHPWRAAECGEEQVALLERLAERPQVVAIGETGLDGLRGGPLEVQERWLVRHAEVSERLGKPLVLHMVRTSQQIIALHRRLKPQVAWVIHGFRGNANVAHALIKEGLYLSVGERFNADALCEIPPERLLVETDESELTIDQVIKRVASSLGLPPDVITETAGTNARRLFCGLK